MLGERLKTAADSLLIPSFRILSRWGFTRNSANWLEMLTAAGGGLCFASRRTALGLALVTLHGLFDYLDGALFRAAPSPKDKRRGRGRHAFIDKICDAFIFLSLALGGHVGWVLAVATAFASVAVTLVGVAGQRMAAMRPQDALFDRCDRVLAFLLLGFAGHLKAGCMVALLMCLTAVIQPCWHIIRALTREVRGARTAQGRDREDS